MIDKAGRTYLASLLRADQHLTPKQAEAVADLLVGPIPPAKQGPGRPRKPKPEPFPGAGAIAATLRTGGQIGQKQDRENVAKWMVSRGRVAGPGRPKSRELGPDLTLIELRDFLLRERLDKLVEGGMTPAKAKRALTEVPLADGTFPGIETVSAIASNKARRIIVRPAKARPT